jgi:hypothetical protein
MKPGKKTTYLDQEIKRNGFVPGCTKYELALDMLIKNKQSNMEKGKRKMLFDQVAERLRISPSPAPNAHRLSFN